MGRAGAGRAGAGRACTGRAGSGRAGAGRTGAGRVGAAGAGGAAGAPRGVRGAAGSAGTALCTGGGGGPGGRGTDVVGSRVPVLAEGTAGSPGAPGSAGGTGPDPVEFGAPGSAAGPPRPGGNRKAALGRAGLVTAGRRRRPCRCATGHARPGGWATTMVLPGPPVSEGSCGVGSAALVVEVAASRTSSAVPAEASPSAAAVVTPSASPADKRPDAPRGLTKPRAAPDITTDLIVARIVSARSPCAHQLFRVSGWFLGAPVHGRQCRLEVAGPLGHRQPGTAHREGEHPPRLARSAVDTVLHRRRPRALDPLHFAPAG